MSTACKWQRGNRKTPTLTEWHCINCDQTAYSNNHYSPTECKKLLGSGYKKLSNGLKISTLGTNAKTNRARGVRQLMRILIILGIVAGGILLFPLVSESSSGSCHAVEKRFINTLRRYGNEQDLGATIFMDMFSEATQGEVAARLVKTEYPNLPPFIGCTIVYYRAVFDDREMLKYRNLLR